MCSIHFLNDSNSANFHSSKKSEISTKDCLIILPVQSVACQTSEFHICPSGNPAARHDADILA
jgi:hypothetical protein